MDEVPPEERTVGVLATTRMATSMPDARFGGRDAVLSSSTHIAKRHEVRATVIGDRVFAARIHSQYGPASPHRLRDMSAEIRYEAETLPAGIEARCLDFVHSYGLTYGALDFIVTPDGDYVFLENNPVGQFLFVEQLVPELDMTGALAACLIAGARAETAR